MLDKKERVKVNIAFACSFFVILVKLLQVCLITRAACELNEQRMKYTSFLFFIFSSTFFLCSHGESYFCATSSDYSTKNQAHSSVGFSFSIDQKSGRRPQRICNQWDDSSQQLLYPNCTAKEINLLMRSPSLAKDFVRAIDDYVCQAMQEGLSRSGVECEVLSWHQYYRIPAFVDYIKTFSSYRSYIKELRNRLVAQKIGWYRLKRVFGLLEDNFDYKFELAEKLYAEIVEQEKKECVIAEQQKEREFLQELRTNQEEIRATFDRQRHALQPLYDEWAQVQDIYQEYGLFDDGRFERRKQALDAINTDGCIYETKSYTLSGQAKEFMNDKDINFVQYQTCYGNQLQQAIHLECIDGINHLASLPQTSVMYDYKENIAHCFDAAREYNQVGDVEQATMVSDFCWELLDYGKAIAEGVFEGVVDTVQDFWEHPEQALLTVVAGELLLAYDVGKVLYNVADLGITYALDSKSGKKKWDDYIVPLTQLSEAIEKKEISLRDAVKGTAKFFTQRQARGKLYKGMGNLCKTAKVKALAFVKKNRRSVGPEQYMKMPEGAVFGGLYNGVTDNKNFKKNGDLDKVKDDLQWTRHGSRHIPPPNLSWKEIIKITQHGTARYHPKVKIRELELHAWKNGIPVRGKNYKIFKMDKIIGANEGKETMFMRVECSANTVHGHPISELDYMGYLKK